MEHRTEGQRELYVVRPVEKWENVGVRALRTPHPPPPPSKYSAKD